MTTTVLDRLPRLFRQLKSGGAQRRTAVCRELGTMRAPTVRSELLAATEDADARVRAAACESLGEQDDATMSDAIARLSRDAAPEVRVVACRTAVKFKHRGFGIMTELLSDSDETVIRAAFAGLLAVGAAGAGALRAFFPRANGFTRIAAARRIGETKDVSGADLLVDWLGDDDPVVCSEAATALGELGVATGFEVLTRLVGRPEPGLARSALTALEKLGRGDSARALFLVCSGEAITAPDLARLRELIGVDPQIFNLLLGRLQDQAWVVRWAVCVACGRLQDPRAIPALFSAVEDVDADVARAAREALLRMGDLAPAVLARIESVGPVARAALCPLLRELADPQVEIVLHKLRTDAEITVAIAAMEALGHRGDRHAVAELLGRIDGAVFDIRAEICAALGRLRVTEAFDELVKRLKDDDEMVRRSAGLALGELQDARAVVPLLDCLTDTSPVVRDVATSVLVAIGERELVDALQAVLADNSTGRRTLAQRAANGDLRCVDVLLTWMKTVGRPVSTEAELALVEIWNAAQPQREKLACPVHALRVEAYSAKGSEGATVSFFGCRHENCRRAALTGDASALVAILDETWEGDWEKTAGGTNVNWLRRRTCFDFDQVTIKQICETDVMVFLTGLGNDPDSTRRARYKKMTCTVATQAKLTTNAIEICRKTFAHVVSDTEENL